ncbi:MAG: acyl-CoA thioesterase [Dokdonella sp.]|nr:MAG: acyl-CoA thioesterase [Dokdonella sp.]
MTPPATAPVVARVPISVRWGDLDAFNHVNNAAFLVYAQEARIVWLGQLGASLRDASMMPVVAAASLNFRRQLGWPARIVVELSVARLGRSSLTLAHRIVDERDDTIVYADGDTVMVWIDPASGRSIALPAAVQALVQSCAASGSITSNDVSMR